MASRIGSTLVAAALAGSLVACSEDPSPGRDDIIARIQSDPRTADTPDATAACLADWYLNYATPEDIAAFVDGDPEARTPEEIAPDEQATSTLLGCLKGATEVE
ncbi:hypothetical protein [Actinophytocola glycyrrhizae]|uniref:Lipoprotein n=1 Tax=Actinophytocola glycyrrhizae TaxID=2044873 RepID=A0ABV9RX91_9PSEU